MAVDVLFTFFFFFKQKTAYEIMPSLVGSEMCIRDSGINAEYMGQTAVTRLIADPIPTRSMQMIKLTINGKAHQLDVAPDTPLLWALRDTLQMTGTKYGCGQALCGACTVHVDGTPVRACSTPVSAVVGRKIRTIEAVDSERVGKVVQEAWRKLDVVQCGYCQSGQIMSAVALLSQNRKPTDAK
eukprot:TRINITY_DN10058_c0_g1_i1.p2 TRINITY_DN10058_c0_g1~~TRINITY_DN10058_c0_g1_i1.p2  ORF type:complete len:184 (-),score=14.20 TRINITY_DN10058_c0_g1_i1:24-575(-)